MKKTDVIIIGAGAAGLMCAIEAGKRGRSVLVLDHANKPGKKILMSGGGRCNFTNLEVKPENFISHNAHFCKSALSRYTSSDFIALVKQYQIPFHEKTLGQLFCDHKSADILNMLLSECKKNNVGIYLDAEVKNISKENESFLIKTVNEEYSGESLVIATGGLSIPTMGASPFGYKVAEQFGIKVWPTQAGLVPFTLQPSDLARFSVLSGIGISSIVNNKRISFKENILFTHRGLSGPAILQISSYWKPGEPITINLLPTLNLEDYLKDQQNAQPKKQLNTLLYELLPKRVIDVFLSEKNAIQKLATISKHDLKKIALSFNAWEIIPNGTEGYRTAEVTLGGVDCDAISSKTMEALNVKGLYFIGEVLDVTGWLGGYNFQWAWASGWAAGQAI